MDYTKHQQRTNQIAELFDVPKRTARRWVDEFETIDSLTERIGINAPRNYLDLIQRREWIPREQDQRLEELLQPLRRWCAKRANGILLWNEQSDGKARPATSGIRYNLGDGWWAGARRDRSEIEFTKEAGASLNLVHKLKEKINQKEARVRYEIRRVDSEWIGLARELNSVEKELIEIYHKHLQRESLSNTTKKRKIKRLKTDFPYLRMNDELIARALGTSKSYSRKFIHIPDEGISDRETSKKHRNAVLKRDEHSCVRCGDTDDLQVHHIIPRSKGGENEIENLATLCTACHFAAHGIHQDCSTVGSYQKTVYDNHTEFWDDWIVGQS